MADQQQASTQTMIHAEQGSAGARSTPASIRSLTMLLAFIMLAGFAVLWQVGSHQREQESLKAQHLLRVLADSRAEALRARLQSRFDVLQDIANNDTVTLYLSEVEQAAAQGQGPDYSLPEITSLRMLVQVAAARGGFEPTYALPPTPSSAPVVVGGVALLNMKREPLVMSRTMPPLEAGGLKDRLAKLPLAKSHFIDLYPMADGRLAMAFVVPVFAVQGTRMDTDQRGWLVAVERADASLLQTDIPTVEPYKNVTLQLVRQGAKQVEWLENKGQDVALKNMDATTPDLVPAKLLQDSGRFVSGVDMSGTKVMAVAQKVANVPWLVMASLPAKDALHEANQQIQRMGLMLAVVFMLVIVGVVWMWRKVSLQRAEELAHDLKGVTAQLSYEHALLEVVTDAEPDVMFICDEEGIYHYANRRLATLLKTKAEDIVGKHLVQVIGPHEAERHQPWMEDALSTRTSHVHVHQLIAKKGLQVLQTTYIPVDDLPTPEGTHKKGVLVVEQDITALSLQKDKAERLMTRLVATLMGLIDKRDKFAADHSVRVAKLARALAESMKLDETTQKTAEIAGSLMNLGKLFIPEALLTQEGRLKAGDLKKIRESIIATADLLQDIEFDGPVADTIRQCKEFWDGSGMLGMKGEKILMAARVVAVANAFISLTSDRAFRKAMSTDDTIRQLLDDMGTLYDRAVVVALANLVVSKGNDWLDRDAA
ncbi:PAS domain-containing protein [bacterium]|nr:PAS domain-containing protein [bacterium]